MAKDQDPACDDCPNFCPDTNRCSFIQSEQNIKDWEAGFYPENCAYIKRILRNKTASEETLQRIEEMIAESIGYFERLKSRIHDALDLQGKDRFGQFIIEITEKIQKQQPLENVVERGYVVNLLELENCKKMQEFIFLSRYKKKKNF